MTLGSHPLRTAFAGALVVLLLFSPGMSLHAEILGSIGELKPGSRLAAYFFGREQVNDLYAVGRHWDKKLGLQQDCKGPYNIQPVNLFLLKPIDFPDSKPHPASGVWQHRFVFERCGKRMTYNAVFIGKNGEKPETRPYIPGTTNASMLLVSDTLKGAYPAALLRLGRNKDAKDCKEIEVIDTRLTLPPRVRAADGKAPAPWEEAWTFRGCGRDVELQIIFAPDGKGGTFYSIKGG